MKTAIFSVFALGLSVGTAQAATHYFNLTDFPAGGASADYDYGLRLDRESPPAFWSFSNGTGATLSYDDEALTASITGDVRESFFGKEDGVLWSLTYTMSGLTDLGDGGFIDFTGAGSGTLTNGGTTLNLASAANREGFYFVFDTTDSRLPDYGITLPGDTSIGHGWAQSGPGANDFLFTATPISEVPIPAAGFMLIAGIGGLVGLRKRRKAS